MHPLATLSNKQTALVEALSPLSVDPSLLFEEMIHWGNNIGLPDGARHDKDLIGGCMAKVWLVAELKEEKIYYQGDSNASLTKGLLALLIHLCSGEKVDTITSTSPLLPRALGLERLMSMQRNHGLHYMEERFKDLARSFLASPSS